uniref:Uncharacterized protein n=1 Tax=Aegilops tauschii subsp. strangulata TaxID=200361 RepID=A0A453B8V1_AEGTS
MSNNSANLKYLPFKKRQLLIVLSDFRSPRISNKWHFDIVFLQRQPALQWPILLLTRLNCNRLS